MSFTKKQGVKRFFVEAGLNVLAFGHISIIDAGKTIELAVDVKTIYKVEEICKYFKLVIYKTFYCVNSSNEQYYKFVNGVVRRMERSIGKEARSDRIKFLKEWQKLAKSENRNMLYSLFYNEAAGVMLNHSGYEQ